MVRVMMRVVTDALMMAIVALMLSFVLPAERVLPGVNVVLAVWRGVSSAPSGLWSKPPTGAVELAPPVALPPITLLMLG